ncbi:MAG TPA: NAD(P)-binding domain-containing protein, partial [Candidatus Acidoferrales bacterium]|nr:NAD(P)-binding domain-containing protein [Candidatus Acidoferrales bacterium]
MASSIGVIGAGGWGIALTKLLADKGESVTLWCHGSETYREITDIRESRSYLPGIILPRTVALTRALQEAVAGKQVIVCAVPSHVAQTVMSAAVTHVSTETMVL